MHINIPSRRNTIFSIVPPGCSFSKSTISSGSVSSSFGRSERGSITGVGLFFNKLDVIESQKLAFRRKTRPFFIPEVRKELA
jgi:hypothetical protein